MGIPAKTRVTLAGEGGGGPRREFCLSRRAALLLALLFLVLLAGFVLQLSEILISRQHRASVEVLERQLADARAEILATHILEAELEQSRRLQQELMVLLGVPRPDSLNAKADSLCDVPPGTIQAGGVQNDGAPAAVPFPAAPLPAEPSPPPSRWPAAGPVIREFTYGDTSRGVEEHLGLDIAGEAGDPVVAAAGGDVDFVGSDDILGNYIEIRHWLDYVTIYGHCGQVIVGPGHRVRAGEQVAKMGRSGQTAINQLHFEVWQRGEAVDPRKLLAGEPPPR
jgi:murein DD-endopeptidase MepM/ murein hydrolase activator NlpD